LAVTFLHLVVVARWKSWYGGYSFGSRMTLDLIPWFILLGTVAIHGAWQSQLVIRGWRAGWGLRLQATVAVVTIIASIAIHSRAAWSLEPHIWNAVPESVTLAPERLWDVRHPQFLAGLVSQAP
jgi:hypothetical protein